MGILRDIIIEHESQNPECSCSAWNSDECCCGHNWESWSDIAFNHMLEYPEHAYEIIAQWNVALEDNGNDASNCWGGFKSIHDEVDKLERPRDTYMDDIYEDDETPFIAIGFGEKVPEALVEVLEKAGSKIEEGVLVA